MKTHRLVVLTCAESCLLQRAVNGYTPNPNSVPRSPIQDDAKKNQGESSLHSPLHSPLFFARLKADETEDTVQQREGRVSQQCATMGDFSLQPYFGTIDACSVEAVLSEEKHDEKKQSVTEASKAPTLLCSLDVSDAQTVSYPDAVKGFLAQWQPPKVHPNSPLNMALPLYTYATKKAAKTALHFLGNIAFRPAVFYRVCQTLHLAHRLGLVKPLQAPEWKTNTEYNLDDAFCSDQFHRPASSVQQINPALAMGWPTDANTSDKQAGFNTLVSELCNKLAKNSVANADEQFTVIFQGKKHNSVPALFSSFIEQNYDITAEIEMRPADFLGIFATDIESGAQRPVPHCVFVRTQQFDAQGREALAAATHAQVNFRIEKPATDLKSGQSFPPSGQDMSSRVCWGHDVRLGIGFRPHGVMAVQPWEASYVSNKFQGSEALALTRWTEVIAMVNRKMSEDNHLLGDGYGPGGMCLDAAATLQLLMTGETSLYPLVLNKALYAKAIDALLSSPAHLQYHEALAALKIAINRFPSDRDQTPSNIHRGVASNPWVQTDTPAPFEAVRHGQGVLASAIEAGKSEDTHNTIDTP